jgi:hypothetical protein
MVIETSVREGGGQRNRRLGHFSFRLSNELRVQRADCAQNCAQSPVPQTSSEPRTQSPRVVALSAKGDGLHDGRLHALTIECVRVNACITYTCRCAVRWPRG